MNKLCDRVKAARLSRGLTQTELGELVKVSQQAIHRIESGDSANSKYLLKIALVLGVSIEWLVEGKGQMEKSTEAQEDTPQFQSQSQFHDPDITENSHPDPPVFGSKPHEQLMLSFSRKIGQLSEQLVDLSENIELLEDRIDILEKRLSRLDRNKS